MTTRTTTIVGRAVRDAAFAFLAGTVVSARIGRPERAYAMVNHDDVDAALEPVLVWCDVSAPTRGVIERGDVVMVRDTASDECSLRVQTVRGMEGDWSARYGTVGRGRCELTRSARWSGGREDTRGEDSDVGVVPIGVIHGRVSAVIWPPRAAGFTVGVGEGWDVARRSGGSGGSPW